MATTTCLGAMTPANSWTRFRAQSLHRTTVRTRPHFRRPQMRTVARQDQILIPLGMVYISRGHYFTALPHCLPALAMLSGAASLERFNAGPRTRAGPYQVHQNGSSESGNTSLPPGRS